MVRKKAEGDEEQRRTAAHEAERQGERPSERGATTGASKQRTHLPGGAGHEERVAATEQGKQQWPREEPGPSGPAREASPYEGRGRPGYSDQHEDVYQAVAEVGAEHRGTGATLQEAAERSGTPPEQTRALLHDLVSTHRLVREVQEPAAPGGEPRYEIRGG
jgi:hypothetical protein